MPFVNPNILAQIFGKGGAINSAPEDKQQAMITMLASMGAGATQASAQPGADFSQALGGAAGGMVQGQQLAQQSQMNQLKMAQAEQEMARQERLAKIMGDILKPKGSGFAGQVDARLPQVPQIGRATATPYQGAGGLSAQYETGGGGVGTISTGQGDPGGQSYGPHQLSSNAGTMTAFLQSPEGQPFATHFSGQQPGTPQFNQSYQEVAQGAGPAFETAQKQFLERTHVQPVMQAAQKAGLPVDSPAIQQALYSQAIQHSGDGNLEIINTVAAQLGPNAPEDKVVEALYNARERYATNALERSGASPEVINGVKQRYQREKQDALALTGSRQVGGPLGGQPAAQPAQPALNGYQQADAQAQVNDPLAGMPDTTRRLLAAMAPEDALKAVVDMQAGGGDTPARIQEAQLIAQQTGEPVGTVLARMRKIMGDGEDGLTTSTQTRIQQADMLMQADPTLDESTARNIAFGRYKVSRNPVTGQADVIDVATGRKVGETTEAVASTVEPGAQAAPGEEVDVSLAFGAPSVVANVANTIADTLGNELPRPEVEDAIRRVVSLGIQGDVLLSQQFSGRVSNQLLDMIGQLKAKPASFFEGPARGRTSMEEMRRLIDRDLERQTRIANSEAQGPRARQEARAAIEALTDYRGELDSVLGAWGSYGQQQGAAPASGGSGGGVPEGWSQELWDVLTDEEKAQLTGGE